MKKLIIILALSLSIIYILPIKQNVYAETTATTQTADLQSQKTNALIEIDKRLTVLADIKTKSAAIPYLDPTNQTKITKNITDLTENLTKIKNRINGTTDTEKILAYLKEFYAEKIYKVIVPQYWILVANGNLKVIDVKIDTLYTQLNQQYNNLKDSDNVKDKAKAAALLSDLKKQINLLNSNYTKTQTEILPITADTPDAVTILKNNKDIIINTDKPAITTALEDIRQIIINLKKTNTPTPIISGTPTPIETTDIAKGTLLGNRPKITGVMGWNVKAITSHQYFFQKEKDLGITNLRIMSVLDEYNSADPNNWPNLASAITTINSTGQSIILCLGELASPPVPNETIDANSIALKAMIDYLVKTYGVDKVNKMPIELDNEYGASNLEYLLQSYYNVIKDREATYKNLSIKIYAPTMQRTAYNQYGSLARGLKYMHANNIPLDGITLHYYLKGASATPPDFSFATWLAGTRDTITKSGYDPSKLPILVTEYGLNGVSNDPDLKDAGNSVWLASRLGDTSYYGLNNYTFFISGAYGQGIWTTGGWLGLFSGYDKSYGAYAVEREIELENKFGDSQLYSVKGITDPNIGGVTDGYDKWLFWNKGTTPVTIKVPSKTVKNVAYVDKNNGNIVPIITQLGQLGSYEKYSTFIDQRSNPFNDPSNGNPWKALEPRNNIIELTINPSGVAYLGKN